MDRATTVFAPGVPRLDWVRALILCSGYVSHMISAREADSDITLAMYGVKCGQHIAGNQCPWLGGSCE